MGKQSIAVNTRLLLPEKLEGIGWFCYETLKRITQRNPDIHFYFLFDRNFSPEFLFSDNITPILLSPQARHPLLWKWWFHISVKKTLSKLKPDLFLTPDGFSILNSDIKTLPVIHDINFVHRPQDLKKSHARYYNKYFPEYARQATRIATVSEYSRRDMAEHFGISKDKIDVVYNGVNTILEPIPLQEQKKIREQYTEGKPFFLYIGSIHARKNIVNMLKAFDMYKEETAAADKFIFAGSKKWWTYEMELTFRNMKYKEDVLFLGRVSSEQYAKLLPSAKALLYVSLFEGFGIPIIEAFQAEVPVITSNSSSMPEVSDNAALLADPKSVSSITNKMILLQNNDSLRQDLIAKGKKRKDFFSWDKTATLLWESIERTMYHA